MERSQRMVAKVRNQVELFEPEESKRGPETPESVVREIVVVLAELLLEAAGVVVVRREDDDEREDHA